MPNYELHQVFGVHQPNPPATYIDRSNRTARLASYLRTGRHCVLYGPSKQGKTVLRSHAFPADACIVVQCGNRSIPQDVYTKILSALGITIEVEQTTSDTRTVKFSGRAGGKVTLWLIAEASAEAEGGKETQHQETVVRRSFGQGPEFVEFVADAIHASGLQVIIEDFHYLSQQSKFDFCHDLKVFWERGLALVLVGVWEKSQFLNIYNGDLDDRYEEIRLEWSNDDFREVLRLGEAALKIELSSSIQNQILESANGNIGLLQRLANLICREADVFATCAVKTNIEEQAYFDAACAKICEGFAARYDQFLGVHTSAIRVLLTTKRRRQIYLAIADCCMQSANVAIQSGIPLSVLHAHCKTLIPNLTEASLLVVLQVFDAVQANHMSPIVASYDPSSRLLTVADRQLLFYSRHGNPKMPWDYHEEVE